MKIRISLLLDETEVGASHAVHTAAGVVVLDALQGAAVIDLPAGDLPSYVAPLPAPVKENP